VHARDRNLLFARSERRTGLKLQIGVPCGGQSDPGDLELAFSSSRRSSNADWPRGGDFGVAAKTPPTTRVSRPGHDAASRSALWFAKTKPRCRSRSFQRVDSTESGGDDTLSWRRNSVVRKRPAGRPRVPLLEADFGPAPKRKRDWSKSDVMLGSDAREVAPLRDMTSHRAAFDSIHRRSRSPRRLRLRFASCTLCSIGSKSSSGSCRRSDDNLQAPAGVLPRTLPSRDHEPIGPQSYRTDRGGTGAAHAP